MCGGFESIKHLTPAALVVRRSPVALVYDDEVEKLRVVLLKISRKVVFTIRLIASSLGDSLIDGKKHICVGRHLAVSLSYLYAVYLDALFFYGVELVVRLVYEDISVGEK